MTRSSNQQNTLSRRSPRTFVSGRRSGAAISKCCLKNAVSDKATELFAACTFCHTSQPENLCQHGQTAGPHFESRDEDLFFCWRAERRLTRRKSHPRAASATPRL